MPIPANIKFDEAISLTQTFVTKLKRNEISPAEIHTFVAELVCIIQSNSIKIS